MKNIIEFTTLLFSLDIEYYIVFILSIILFRAMAKGVQNGKSDKNIGKPWEQ